MTFPPGQPGTSQRRLEQLSRGAGDQVQSPREPARQPADDGMAHVGSVEGHDEWPGSRQQRAPAGEPVVGVHEVEGAVAHEPADAGHRARVLGAADRKREVLDLDAALPQGRHLVADEAASRRGAGVRRHVGEDQHSHGGQRIRRIRTLGDSTRHAVPLITYLYVNVSLSRSAGSLRRLRPGVHAGHEHYKWWALSCTSLGMLLATINSGTLIIALPDLERSLGTSLLQLVWVILAYMIASTVLVLTAGRLSDLFGRKQAYVAASSSSPLASLGAGFSANGTELILWRILQGIGAAFLFANAAALVTDAFPQGAARPRHGHQHDGRRRRPGARPGARRGAGRDLLALGLLVQRAARRSPARSGARSSCASSPSRTRCAASTCSAPLLFVTGLTGLVLGVSKGGLSGWNDPVVIGGLVAAAVLLPLFVLDRDAAAGRRCSTSRSSATGMFAAATGAAFINGLSRFALLFVFVFYFQGAQGDDPITAGIKLAPMAIGMLISSPLAGHLGGPPRLARARGAAGWS